MNNETNILILIIGLVLVGHSWYVHYIVKDGLARLMLLWGCGFLFGFLSFRLTNLLLLQHGIIDTEMSRFLLTQSVWFIYAVIAGQWFIQRGHAQRDEGYKAEKDKKELKQRRKDDTCNTTRRTK